MQELIMHLKSTVEIFTKSVKDIVTCSGNNFINMSFWIECWIDTPKSVFIFPTRFEIAV